MPRALSIEGKSLVLDGPMATHLEHMGHNLDDDLWSARLLMTEPEAIRQVHLDYFRAGADIAITASYQATIQGFMAQGISEKQARDLILSSVYLAQDARALYLDEAPHRPLWIAGSVGSYGAFAADGSEYRGDFDLDQQALIQFHRPRMQLLQQAGADLFAMETIPSLHEAQALTRLMGEFPEMTAWISFSALDEAHTAKGEPIEEAATWLQRQPQITAMGINCSNPKYIEGLLSRMHQVTDKPLIVYPNSGETWLADTHTWGGDAATVFPADLMDRWYAVGARIIGGCCRTTPETITRIAQWCRA